MYTERPWNEALSAKISEVQESFKNIPSMLYFSPSSVTFDGIGVYAAEALPKGINFYQPLYIHNIPPNSIVICKRMMYFLGKSVVCLLFCIWELYFRVHVGSTCENSLVLHRTFWEGQCCHLV